MTKPTLKQRMQYLRAKRNWSGNNAPSDLFPDDDDEDEEEEIGEGALAYLGPEEEEDEDDETLVPNPLYDPETKRFCFNPACNLAWLKDDEGKTLDRCGKCKWAFYCSVGALMLSPPSFNESLPAK